MRLIDYTGQRIGQFTVIEKTDRTKYAGKSRVYICRCDCGNVKELSTSEFSSAKSCGCLHAANKEKFKKMNIGKVQPWTLPPGESSVRNLMGSYIRCAHKRGYEFALSQQEFLHLIKQPCYYCGIEPLQIHKAIRKQPLVYNGIDRTDNTRGYILTNCVPCCKHCNRAKDTLTYVEFATWIKRIHQRLVD